MSPTTHVLCGPADADRLAPLLAAYRDAASTGFGAALVLTATRDYADAVRECHGPGLAPPVFDLQAFADELVRVHDPAARPHSEADRNRLVASVIAELRTSGELPGFAAVAAQPGFAEAAGRYVAELKESGVDLRQLLKANPARGGLSPKRHAQTARIFDRYQRRLAKLRRYDPVDRLGRAAELWAGGVRRPFHRVRAVFVAGFTALRPFELKLLAAVRESVEEFWIEVPEGDGSRELRTWAAAAAGRDVVTERVEAVAADAGDEGPTACAG